ncbi:MAG: hypothetical protein HYZ11_11630 [Candidatus Tectomicrobia bacterium]|uniref:UGSC-like domain-containing protein n=1 Tax=Tectimicrobiota bacterium TaxID=2528274 RepID=A0A932MP44_UNCTE|nr:hypothetical protein [Candidatus Tectomicrobia bacterium]
MPTVTFCSSVFAALGASERQALGMPGLPIVVVPHPVGGIPPEAARAMGDGAAGEALRALTADAETLRREYRERVYLPPRRVVQHKPLFA